MKGRHLGEFEELVLLAVQALGADAYGASIQQLLERETTRAVALGAVYAALDRLEDKRCLTSCTQPGTAVRGGRRRRAFALTPAGGERLADLRRLRERLYRRGAAPVRGRA
jgi:DNA-binding PadR family transcriptional regulator